MDTDVFDQFMKNQWQQMTSYLESSIQKKKENEKQEYLFKKTICHPYESTRAKVKTHNTQRQYVKRYKYLTHKCLRYQKSNWTESSKLEDISAKLKGEPVENFNNGNEAEAKAKSAEAAKARDEVQPSHLRRSLKF